MSSQKLTVLRVVVASPTDVEAEWRVVDKVVEELNHGLAGELGLLLRVSTWKTDSHAGFHANGPQGLIDSTLRLDEADVLIALFWTRFGSPVLDARSGTQHEILKAVEAWKRSGHPQVMVFFKDLPYNPRNQQEHEQWLQVRRFRDEFPTGGLWRSYKTKPQFETQLRRDLTNFLKSRNQDAQPTSTRSNPATAPVAAQTEDPVQYTAEFSFVPRSSSGTSHEYTLNVMLSNWSAEKLTDYDVELLFPGELLSSRDRTHVDENVSTPSRAVLRVPIHAGTSPPPVYPGQTRDVLSFKYTITTNHLMDESTMLKHAELVVRFANGYALQVVAPIKDLHNSELANGNLRRGGDEEPRYEIGYQSVQKRRDLDAFAPGGRRTALKKL